MTEKEGSIWKTSISVGLVVGAISLLLSLVGMVAAFNGRYIVTGLVTMGQLLLFIPLIVGGFSTITKSQEKSLTKGLLGGVVSGVFSGLVLALLLLVGSQVDLRAMFPNASPELYGIISFGMAPPLGYVIPFIYGIVFGLMGAGLALLPSRIRTAVLTGSLWVVVLGLFRDMFALIPVFNQQGFLRSIFSYVFAPSGLSIAAAIVLFILFVGYSYWRSGRPEPKKQRNFSSQKPAVRWGVLIIGSALVLSLPFILGVFFTEVLDNVGLYLIMALGLNIVVGYAGLLDLGYVAFFAIGAYTMGVLTSPELGFFHFNFWTALPFALLVTTLSGVILGLPVLRMRGDYLAIVTLGFGEIVRILALSEWLRPYIGGTQGIQKIAIPIPENILASFSLQTKFYYLILAGCLIVGFIAWRLKDSRLGRSWIALREDEDVAQAMGLNTVTTKLMAFATGATFAGLSGAIFASKLNSAYPHSFDLLVSVFVLCIIIIGGMGSIPGAILGSFFLIGLPELLREFSEFRLLVVGAVMVAMMLYKPEGLWPEERRKLELHEGEEALGGIVEEELAPASSTSD